MREKIITRYLYDNQVIRLTLNTPKGNILDSEMMTGIQSVLNSLFDQPQLKLIQFIGAGDHFSFGASVEEHQREQAVEMLSQFHKIFYTLIDLAIPTAALVTGNCLGGGMELALMCNFIFADCSARFGQPEANLGVFAPPASLIIPMKIGQAKADDLLLTGRIFPVNEAVSMGLVTQLYEDREMLLNETESWIQKYLLPKSASSLRHVVKAARWEFNNKLLIELGKLEKIYLEELMSTHDANEGIAAFIEKRSPKWQDK